MSRRRRARPRRRLRRLRSSCHRHGASSKTLQKSNGCAGSAITSCRWPSARSRFSRYWGSWRSSSGIAPAFRVGSRRGAHPLPEVRRTALNDGGDVPTLRAPGRRRRNLHLLRVPGESPRIAGLLPGVRLPAQAEGRGAGAGDETVPRMRSKGRLEPRDLSLMRRRGARPRCLVLPGLPRRVHRRRGGQDLHVSALQEDLRHRRRDPAPQGSRGPKIEEENPIAAPVIPFGYCVFRGRRRYCKPSSVHTGGCVLNIGP